ncbi:MAG TPA: protein kinase [Verrucomicrobiae bacterium]|jgi:hypothetical protein|nr:protein kinase [Verrucomicrobiae bacterium]
MNEALSREEELFDAARQITDAAQRRTYLSRAADGDDALRRRVEKLLAALPEADRLFDQHFAAYALSNESSPALLSPAGLEGGGPGSFIGPYRIAAKIGEGGCGEVYLAEQMEPVRRRVALKIIKLGMDTRAVIARFNAERQALAMMDHPNIARVFDSGATAAGRPYFVMELVSGVKITEFCDKAELGLAARLELFVQVCHAVQHAHQKGVVHRDLKPSNILVAWQDGAPAPKVIDFGIAKATEERLVEQTVFTAHAQLVGTPAYMSPEQADLTRPDIDTRSDIYSLGVVLYELLTGLTPFDARELLASGVDEMRRKLREAEPAAPSARLTALAESELAQAAQRRQMEPHKLILVLRGDLDWIAMKALEKDRGRRYQTANGLAMDVQRFLGNEPIVARPPTRLYRFQKLVRRNKGVFASVCAVALVLLAGLGTSTWLLRGEIQARQRAVAAEQREARLRREAEGREKITQAAILLNDERMPEADKLMEGVEMSGPSTEGAAVYRALGEWHALAGRWKLAAQRFESLARVNQAEGWDVATLGFLECGVTLVEDGDRLGYKRFQQLCLSRFQGATNVVVAERMLKVNLLWPHEPEMEGPLQAWARAGAQPLDDNNNGEFRQAWRAISLALFEYRRGNDKAALEWCRKSLSSPQENAPRAATAQVIRALALQRQGRRAEARQQLDEAGAAMERAFVPGLPAGEAQTGFWFDWVFARLLMREALPQIG